jgi:hypothetical protein
MMNKEDDQALSRESTSSADSAAAVAPSRVWRFVAAALILFLPVIGLLIPNPSLPKGGDLFVLVEVPSVADFLQDTAVVNYLVDAGIGGVVVRPSTLGGLINGPDVSMASGGEILRLFRMESIANIWMWEQLKGRPIRGDAVYIFTNQFLFFESILTTLRASFGENAARPYNDGEHDFGGGIPGNFIIEAFVPYEEIRSASFGLERNLRERLASFGLRPVIELSGGESPEADGSAAYLVTTDIAAQAAWRAVPGERVFLLDGVRNPGWRRVTPAQRSATDTAIRSGSAIVTPLADAIRLLGDLKSRGVSLGRATAGESRVDDAYAAAMRLTERLRRLTLLLALVGLSFVFLQGLIPPAFLLRAGFVVFACGGAGLFLAWHPEEAAAFLAVFFGLFAARSWERLTASLRLWLFAAVAIVLVHAGSMVAAGRAFPNPWSLSLVTIALVAWLDLREGRINRLLLPIVALVASGFLPWSLWSMAGVTLLALVLPRFISSTEIRAVLRATLWPAGLVVLAHGSIELQERIGLAVLFVIAVAALTYLDSRPSWHDPSDNSTSSAPIPRL